MVDGQPESVVKIWHRGQEPQDADAKFRYMTANRVAPEPGATWRIAWPQHLGTENGASSGYTMPYFKRNLGRNNRDPDSWELIIEYYNRKQAGETGESQGRVLRIDDLARIAQNSALCFKAVHEAGYVIGDVK